MFVFFFQAEDGIRDLYVTGVQTCALPISADRGLARNDLQEAVLLREPFEVGPWIGDRDERAALGGEVRGVRARLERRAGLRRGDEERLAHVQRVLEATD